jgi:hypothetical protein
LVSSSASGKVSTISSASIFNQKYSKEKKSGVLKSQKIIDIKAKIMITSVSRQGEAILKVIAE